MIEVMTKMHLLWQPLFWNPNVSFRGWLGWRKRKLHEQMVWVEMETNKLFKTTLQHVQALLIDASCKVRHFEKKFHPKRWEKHLIFLFLWDWCLVYTGPKAFLSLPVTSSWSTMPLYASKSLYPLNSSSLGGWEWLLKIKLCIDKSSRKVRPRFKILATLMALTITIW